MLSFVERTAVVAGVQRLFALSTTTMQWFTERGFVEVRARLRIHYAYRVARATSWRLRCVVGGPRRAALESRGAVQPRAQLEDLHEGGLDE